MIIELVRTFYLKNVPAKFQKYLKHISWVISGTRSSKLSCNPRHRSRNTSCNHRHHLLQPSWQRIFSSSNNQKTRVDSDIRVIAGLLLLMDCISGAENETLRALSGHTNGNIEMRSPSAAAMMTTVAAATIVRSPPPPPPCHEMRRPVYILVVADDQVLIWCRGIVVVADASAPNKWW